MVHDGVYLGVFRYVWVFLLSLFAQISCLYTFKYIYEMKWNWKKDEGLTAYEENVQRPTINRNLFLWKAMNRLASKKVKINRKKRMDLIQVIYVLLVKAIITSTKNKNIICIQSTTTIAKICRHICHFRWHVLDLRYCEWKESIARRW